MVLALIPFVLSAALSGGEVPAPPPRFGAQATVRAQAEVIAPVTNDLRVGGSAPLRLVSSTRDGRKFVEFQ